MTYSHTLDKTGGRLRIASGLWMFHFLQYPPSVNLKRVKRSGISSYDRSVPKRFSNHSEYLEWVIFNKSLARCVKKGVKFALRWLIKQHVYILFYKYKLCISLLNVCVLNNTDCIIFTDFELKNPFLQTDCNYLIDFNEQMIENPYVFLHFIIHSSYPMCELLWMMKGVDTKDRKTYFGEEHWSQVFVSLGYHDQLCSKSDNDTEEKVCPFVNRIIMFFSIKPYQQGTSFIYWGIKIGWGKGFIGLKDDVRFWNNYKSFFSRPNPHASCLDLLSTSDPVDVSRMGQAFLLNPHG